MVENRKLFYAISVLLLSCCQIITMFPHNVGQERGGNNAGNNGDNSSITKSPSINSSSSSISDTSNNSEYNRANIDSGSNQSYGTTDDDSEFIIAVERKLQTMGSHNEGGGFSQSNMGVWEASPDSIASENVDDLIFLDKRPINHHQQQPHREYVAQLPPRPNEQQHQLQQYRHRHRHQNFEIHHHLSADGLNSGSSSSSDEHSTDSLTHTAFASSSADSDKAPKDVIDDDVGTGETDAESDAEADADADVAVPPHEIDLQPDNNEEDLSAVIVVIPLDLSDFLSLIPAERVKAIVANYYLNDPEVQRAHAFMSSRDFAELKHHIIAIPEMSAFLRYLNSSGLDLVKFVTALSSMTTMPPTPSLTRSPVTVSEKGFMPNETNDIEYAQKHSESGLAKPAISNPVLAPAATIEIQTQPPSSASATESAATSLESASAAGPGGEPPITLTVATTIDMDTTTMKEQLNGLHGLVDSILDVLPQDQILATFFDKLESSEQFSKLVDNIGSPEFSKILNNMQNSVPLRNLIFTLHNNGIYVIRIVDSLKSYFFLGGF